MIDLTSCPSCGAPAEVEWRAVAAGTDGPVEHAKVSCVRRHWYLMPTAWLAPSAGRPDAQEPDAA